MQDLIDMAHSELRTLIVKAARGAGMPWGLAEEAGWAAEWLSRRGMPAADWAAGWLDAVLAGRPDPVRAGVEIADRLASSIAPPFPAPLPQDLGMPGYLLPFLHRIALHHGPVAAVADGVPAALVTVDGTLVLGPAWAEVATGWQLHAARSEPPPPPQHLWARLSVSPSVLDCLEGLALRITVPPSDTSRRDAGSALTDND